MHSTSALYQEILAGDHRVETKVEIGSYTYSLDTLVEMRTSRAAFGNDSPAIGLAPAARIFIRVRASSANIPRMATIRPSFRIVNDSNQRSEWIPKGTYFLDTRKINTDGTVELTGYDAMLKTERVQPWSELSLSLPLLLLRFRQQLS